MSVPDRRGFRVDLRLLRELGERLISRDEVAVVELVKNSYDADAASVKVDIASLEIAVEDDGVGMGEKEVLEGWLTIGTSRRTRSPTTEKGRRVLGAKGIGRLAVLRLGQTVVVTTQKRGGRCLQLVMDWKGLRATIDSSDYTPLDDLTVEIRTLKEGPFQEGHGTRISIRYLNAEWDQPKVDRLKIFLSRLIEPRPEERVDFAIMMSAHGQDIPLDSPEVTKTPHYTIEVAADDSGAFEGKVSWATSAGTGEKNLSGQLPMGRGRKRQDSIWKQAMAGGCGPFRLNLKVWDLDAVELKGAKAVLRVWSGVSLVRDGFRVVQPDVDWLGLDLRRVQNPTQRLSTNQIIGSVHISSSANIGLVDKTDREGLLENEPLWILKETIYGLLTFLERERYSLRRRRGLVRGVLLSELDPAPLREIAMGLPEASREPVEHYASQLENFRTILEEWMLGRDRMATMGLLGARLVHEARSALMKITDNYPLLESNLPSLEPPVRERIGRMVEGGRLLDTLFRELDPFLRFRTKRRQSVNLAKVVESLRFLYEPELRKNEIEFNNAIPTGLSLRANLTDIYVLAANLLDNAVYWLSSVEGKRTVEFRAGIEGDILKLEVGDSGPGVETENAEFIFDAGFSTKPDGTGLGLSIVRDIIEYYGGSATVARDPLLGGALFLITLRLEGGSRETDENPDSRKQ